MILHHVLLGRNINLSKRLIKVVGTESCLLLLYSGLGLEPWATTADVPKKLKKTSCETLTFRNYSPTSRHFRSIFPLRASWDPLGSGLGDPWGPTLAPLGPLGVFLGLAGVSWALSWAPLGLLRCLLGLCWAPLGVLGVPLEYFLGASGADWVSQIGPDPPTWHTSP